MMRFFFLFFPASTQLLVNWSKSAGNRLLTDECGELQCWTLRGLLEDEWEKNAVSLGDTQPERRWVFSVESQNHVKSQSYLPPRDTVLTSSISPTVVSSSSATLKSSWRPYVRALAQKMVQSLPEWSPQIWQLTISDLSCCSVRNNNSNYIFSFYLQDRMVPSEGIFYKFAHGENAKWN